MKRKSEAYETMGQKRRAIAFNLGAKAVKGIYQGYKSYQKTRAKKLIVKLKRTKRSPQTGKSGGKFGRKPKTSPFLTCIKKGAVTNKEHGVVLTGLSNTNAIYMGHSTHGNVALMNRTFWRAIVRDLYKQSGVDVVDMETEAPGTGNVSYIYSTGVNSADVTQSIATVGKSFNVIAFDLAALWVVVMNASAAQIYVTLKTIQLDNGSIVLAKQNYQDARVHFLGKSDLKIQNRTITTGIDDDINSTENVANQPLYGKSYFGKGNGLVPRLDSAGAQAAKGLVTGEDNGLLAYGPALSGGFWLREPPIPTLFNPMPKSNSCKLEPGEIKTSSLLKLYSVRLNDYLNDTMSIVSNTQPKGSYQQNTYGAYHIFALEKMICVSAVDTAPVVGMELQQKMGCYFTFPRKSNAAEIFEDQAFLTQV